MRSIIAKVKEQHAAGRSVVLATLMATQGSTYRRPGARMVITEDGQFQGLVSGGCLEADLVMHAKKVFFDQNSRVIEYDMRAEEEGAWGLALGCNGLVRIHLQYLSGESTSDVLIACEQADRHHQPVMLLTDLSEKHTGAACTALYAQGQYSSTSIEEGSLGPEWQSIKSAAEATTTEFVAEDGTHYLAEIIKPQFHLLILGAGPDASPVCTMAKLAGWRVTLVDHRVAYVGKARMLDADQVVNSEPGELAEKIDLGRIDAALLMSHSLNADTEYFAVLIQSSTPYIGMLGPKDRSEIIIQRQSTEVTQQMRERIYAPVGLDIGGEGPEAIALSIVSEIQARINQCSGQALREKTLGIHD